MGIRFSSDLPSSEPVDPRSRTPGSDTAAPEPKARASGSNSGILHSLSSFGAAMRSSSPAPHRAPPGPPPGASPAAKPASANQKATGGSASKPVTSRLPGQINGRLVKLLRLEKTALLLPIDSAAKAVRRLAKRMSRTIGNAETMRTAGPIALHIPRNYGWPLGLFKRQQLENLPIHTAYDEFLKTGVAHSAGIIAKSAKQRFGFTDIDDERLRAELHAWANGENEPGEGEYSWMDHESGTQSGHSSFEQDSAASDDESPGTTRRVRFAPEAKLYEFDGETDALQSEEREQVGDDATDMPRPEARVHGVEAEADPLEPKFELVPTHSPQHESAKPKRRIPKNPEERQLVRQRSINEAAWDTVMLLKSPRFGPNDRKTTQDMLQKNELRFDIKSQHRIAPEEEPQALEVVRALDRETTPRSFAEKVRGLVQQLMGKSPLPDPLPIPGEDTRYEALQRTNNE